VLITTVHNTLAKDIRSEAEKEALTKLFLSRQKEKAETLIREQTTLIELYKAKCENYEKELMEKTNNRNYRFKKTFNL